MSDAINEDVAFKKKLYRKKLFFIGKKCYTIHGKKIVSVETDCLKKAESNGIRRIQQEAGAYMKDLIDEKNRQEKMKRSIIKYWNVSYGSPEAIGGEEEEKEREHAVGIYPQENHVYDEESELKQAEIKAIDEVSQTKIQQILHEKDDRLQNLIEHEQHEG